MGRDLFPIDDYFVSLIDQASALTGEDLKRLCLRGPEKKLLKARFLQPLIVAVSLGYHHQLKQKGIQADLVLGHSMGEITALAAAGVISDDTAMAMAVKRGELMDEAASTTQGGMIAVLSMALDEIEAIIRQLGLENKVVIANINTPEQIVVSGEKEALDKLSLQISAQDGKHTFLNVSGPWHSPYLKGAYQQFEKWAENIEFSRPQTPIVLNATGCPESDPSKIKKYIARQLCSPVYFRQCLEYCKSAGVDTFCEVGPGRVLSGLVRANGFMQGVRIYNINNLRGVSLAVADIDLTRDVDQEQQDAAL